MSSSMFRIEKHVLPCQHIRAYPHATINEEDDQLHIAINQYTPLDNTNPRPGDITIIAAHANGVGKELYEPLWDDFYAQSRKQGVRIRSIWMADVSFQGESYVLNESKIANDPSWFDHPRDLLHMVNTFRSQMPRPIIGVGHSMGGNNIVNLALMHPRLFESIILIDPVILRRSTRKGNLIPAYLSTLRRDVWPSREAAAAGFGKNKFYQSWDPRVFDLWIKFGLRELPTAIHPTYNPETPGKAQSMTPAPAASLSNKPVVLTTPKQQEVFAFMRGKFPKYGTSLEGYWPPQSTHPDIPEGDFDKEPFYRPEPLITWANLPFLRPRCLYIFPENSPMAIAPGARAERIDFTGIGVSGSGGAKVDAVRDIWIKDAGHFVPFEKPGETADVMVGWCVEHCKRWTDEESARKAWAAGPVQEKINFPDGYVQWMKKTCGPDESKKAKM